MTLNFCTLFDSGYLTRALAMIESLEKNTTDFRLFAYTMDNNCEKILKDLKLKYVTVISLLEFEDERLLKIKSTRTRAEYYWTCTPSIILDSINRFSLDHSIYVDADLLFYSDPKIIFTELNERSILLTDHNYTKKYDQSDKSGRFCVQFMIFKNDTNGRLALEWWRERCLEWCFARQEDGKFGDQKYLDDWETRFSGVYVSQNPGAGIAPWNVQQWAEGAILEAQIFFHYHGVRFLEEGKIRASSYKIPKFFLNQYYKNYIKLLLKWESLLLSRYPDGCFRILEKKDNFFKKFLKTAWHLVQGTGNVILESEVRN